ncbi:sporulation protein [Variovorax sp. PBL-E5]|uniref:sporulation protein n=1 Tax=Variovorax sp. PBL-E5 TaxID=434014 RepID=UPI0013162CE4|nr:sporulation protein [Variovorax sp. PBL-E5]VTU40150.1 hypothetical protein E5CHR_05372 [Variovorax sp. PBL-E5]
MLRVVAVLLLLANLGYYAWTHGALAMFGMEPARFSEREPQRLLQQIRPEVLRIDKDAPAAPGRPASAPGS